MHSAPVSIYAHFVQVLGLDTKPTISNDTRADDDASYHVHCLITEGSAAV